FMLAYLNQVPICGVPGGALFNKVTTLDLVLPRIFAGERISRADVVALGHGGLCQECRSCHFPNCSFGKSSPFEEVSGIERRYWLGASLAAVTG
ncbi:MAG: hypothetical protein WBJ34_06200, partial [Syntrophomonadaceae bacterium]